VIDASSVSNPGSNVTARRLPLDLIMNRSSANSFDIKSNLRESSAG
jgi:hypothetical protein